VFAESDKFIIVVFQWHRNIENDGILAMSQVNNGKKVPLNQKIAKGNGTKGV